MATDLKQLYWMIVVTLFILAILQTIYWIFLMQAANRLPRRSSKDPVMPTSPRSTDRETPSDTEDMYSDNMNRNGGFHGTMTILEGLPGTTEIRLPRSSFSLGRFYNPDENILIALDERSISRRHAHFSTESNACYLTDIGSSYGTSIYIGDSYQNLSLDQREQVYNGDVILFGNTVRVQLRLPGPVRRS